MKSGSESLDTLLVEQAYNIAERVEIAKAAGGFADRVHTTRRVADIAVAGVSVSAPRPDLVNHRVRVLDIHVDQRAVPLPAARPPLRQYPGPCGWEEGEEAGGCEVATEQYYVFGRIYGLATRRATERASQSVVEQLVDLAEQIGAESDLDDLLRLSIRFQWLILETGGSKRLRALFDPLSQIVPGNFYITIPGSADVTRRGVFEMTAAISSRRPEAAEHACWRLIDEIGELVALCLRDRQPS